MGKKVLFISEEVGGADASFINTKRRKKILERLGFKVQQFTYRSTQGFLGQLFRLLASFKKVDVLYIRIDGSGVLDKFTILKLFFPMKKVIWEIHGYKEELLERQNNFTAKWKVVKNNLKRRLLSLLVDLCVFISEELYQYSREKIYIKNYSIIPNFVDITEYNKRERRTRTNLGKLFKNPLLFKVFWTGNPAYPWQAIDLVEETAQKIYKLDKQIIFIIVGSDSWYRQSWYKNLVVINTVPPEVLREILGYADVCLALYHKPKFFPFYFYPLKVLEYMALGKAVIATNMGIMDKLIIHGQSGILTSNSSERIAKALLNIKRNPSLKAKLELNAKRLARTRTTKEALRAYKKAFELGGII